ncbi:MAG: glutathione S-transferase family protein [Solirubrobacteraceae bacterium]
MTTPRLWSWHMSPFSGKARIALAVKQIRVDLIEIHPVKRPPRLRELNPAGRVPVLELGEVAIVESTAICEWAEESGTGPSLWPTDPARRARARGLLRWVDDELLVNFFLSIRKEAFGVDEAHDHPEIVANLRSALAKRWKPLERLLDDAGGRWLTGGETPTLPDLAAIPLAVRLQGWKPELTPDPATYPLVSGWLGALRDHPAAVEVDRRGEPAAA